jgi:hypothetical protein
MSRPDSHSVREGSYTRAGQRAIEELARIGEPAVDAMVDATRHPPPSELHPIDRMDSVSDFFWVLARKVPDKLIDLLANPADWAGLYVIYHALGNAVDRRSLDVLLAALKHRELWVRWASCEALIRRKSKRAVPALIEALRDRSDLVKSTLVFSMERNKMLRRPAAIPHLERIVANKSIAKHGPGLHDAASKLIERITRETN